MKVSLSDDEARSVRVAIRLAEAALTELVSMSPDKDIRLVLMDQIKRMHTADRKLELEKRIAEVAEATGHRVVIGRQGHKDQWFAHCDGIEYDGSNAGQALEAVVRGLRERAEGLARDASRREREADVLRSLEGPRA